MRGLVRSILGTPLVTRLAARRARGGLLVVMYHDLRDDDDFDNWLRVGRSDFAAQLSLFTELGRVVHPDDLQDPGRLSRDELLLAATAVGKIPSMVKIGNSYQALR